MAPCLDCLVRVAAALETDWPLEALATLADLLNKVGLPSAKDLRLGFSKQALETLQSADDLDAINAPTPTWS